MKRSSLIASVAMAVVLAGAGSVPVLPPEPAGAADPVIINDCGLAWTEHEEFAPGEVHATCNGDTFTFQFDGNVVVYSRFGFVLWAAGSNHSPAGKLVFQGGPGGDGNLVVYKANGQVAWAANRAAPGGRLEFDAGGHLAVYDTVAAMPVFSGPAMLPMSPPPATPIEMQSTAYNGDGRAEVFGVDAEGKMWHRWQGCNGQPHTGCPTLTWSPWALLGGNFISAPVIIHTKGIRLDPEGPFIYPLWVFATGANGDVQVARQTLPGSTSLTPWESLGGFLVSKPAVALNADNRLEVFGVGGDGAIYNNWLGCRGAASVCNTPQFPFVEPLVWSGWHRLGGAFTSEPSATGSLNGLQVFGRGLDGGVYVARQVSMLRSDAYTGWTSLGGVTVGAPVASSHYNGRAAVFHRGTDNALYINEQTCQTCTAWTGWRSLGGNLTSQPVIKPLADRRLGAFTVWADGAVRYSAPVAADLQTHEWKQPPADYEPLNPWADLCLPVSAAAREMGHECMPVEPYPGDGNRAEPPPPDPPRGNITWIALGDSYTSGTGARSYAKTPDQFGNLTRRDPCYRSPNNYPNQVMRDAKRLYNYTHVTGFTAACHGAETHHILNTNIDGGPPQISYIDQEVDVVFITIGGNDLQFGPKLRRCIDQDCTAGGAPLVTQTELDAVRDRLVTICKRLREKMRPDAILQVSTYPMIFPPMTSSDGNYDKVRCHLNGQGLMENAITSAEMKLIHQAWQRARIMIADAVSRANNVAVTSGINAKAQLADMYDVLKGHEICSSRPWTNSIRMLDASESFHPNEEGHFAQARKLANGFIHWRQFQGG
ncbi:MAG TPA: GDSL-type esterase/lipase family protein [Candidatus Limnocylindrales bacterium]